LFQVRPRVWLIDIGTYYTVTPTLITLLSIPSGERIKVCGRITCNKKYVVYLLKCSCNFYYVGKTKCEVKTMICEHKSSIRNHDQKSPVARHFNSHNHELSALLYMGIELVKAPYRGGDGDTLLLQRYILDRLLGHSCPSRPY
ncbi:unnamed protein product, partial [Coregonus sp. 'balchen']